MAEEPLRGQDLVRLEGPGVDFTLEEGVVRIVFMAWAETQHGEDALGAVEGVQPTMVRALAWAGVVRSAGDREVREVQQEAHEAERI